MYKNEPAINECIDIDGEPDQNQNDDQEQISEVKHAIKKQYLFSDVSDQIYEEVQTNIPVSGEMQLNND